MRLQLRDKFLRNSERIGDELNPKAETSLACLRLPRVGSIVGLLSPAGWRYPPASMGASLPPAISRIDTFVASRVLGYLHDGPNRGQTWQD